MACAAASAARDRARGPPPRWRGAPHLGRCGRPHGSSLVAPERRAGDCGDGHRAERDPGRYVWCLLRHDLEQRQHVHDRGIVRYDGPDRSGLVPGVRGLLQHRGLDGRLRQRGRRRLLRHRRGHWWIRRERRRGEHQARCRQLLERDELRQPQRGSLQRGRHDELVVRLRRRELPRRRELHHPRHPHGRRRQRRHAGEHDVHDRHDGAARADDQCRPGRPDERDHRQLQLQRHRTRRDLRMPPRWRWLLELQQPAGLCWPW